MNIYIDTRMGIVWLSYEYLQEHNIPENTLGNWSKRNICDRIYIDGRAFLDYDTIPEPTRRKLPSKEELQAEYHATVKAGFDALYLRRLQEAYNGPEFIKWVDRIKAAHAYLPPEKVTECARRASVFECLTDILEYGAGRGVLESLYKAYNQLYPGNYSHKTRFSMAIRKAKENGGLPNFRCKKS